MRYWKYMGEYDAETTAFSEFAGASGASPYRPVEDARLKGLRVIASRDAASSLTNGVQIRLTSTSFQPNSIDVGVDGGGLQTAPVAALFSQDWEVDQPVKSGVEVTIEGRNITADTPVTVNVLLFGLFDNGRN